MEKSIYTRLPEWTSFFGQKDDLDCINQENLHKAFSIIDESFNKQLKKYLIELNNHTSYMIKQKKQILGEKNISINVCFKNILWWLFWLI